MNVPQVVTTPAAIRAEGLTKRYGEVLAVDGLTLEIGSGQFVGLLGPNGSGKTTTIHMLASLIQPNTGSAQVAGFDIRRNAVKAREAIGIVFQESALDRTLTVAENLRFAGLLQNLPLRTISERSRELLELFGLGQYRATPVAALSGGMRRALDIVRGVLHQPKVLFLDVPLAPGRYHRAGATPVRAGSEGSQLAGATSQSQRRLPLGGGRKGIEIVKLRPFYAVLERELVRMIRQRTRLVAAMVRPLIWLLVIGGGFNSVVGRAHGLNYQDFLVPGVLGMTTLFGAMLAALTTVYDKESGVMRMMIVAPLPHAWIVLAKMVSAALAAIVQALLLIVLLVLLGRFGNGTNWALLAAAVAAASFACAGIGMLTASFSRTLDNFAAAMNFVIFPVFFLSGSLYPVESLPVVLKRAAIINPYTYGVDFLKHAILPASVPMDFSVGLDIAVLAGFSIVALTVASWRFSQESAYEPMIRVLAGKPS